MATFNLYVYCSQEAVQQALSKVCDKMSPVLKKGCKNLVSKYSGKILDLIAQGVSMSDVCGKIHLCASPPDLRIAQDTLQQPEQQNLGSKQNLLHITEGE